jgi:putative acetyltransferase
MKGLDRSLAFAPIDPSHDAAMAAIVRRTLKDHHLDIPGTAFFDPSLDSLSAYYRRPGRAYYVLLEAGKVIGGVGLAEFDGLDGCCELQKLYLDEAARGRGIGYDMIRYIEDKARRMGYRRIYLETHSDLAAAVHEYQRSGYLRIERPAAVIHTAMDLFYLKEL